MIDIHAHILPGVDDGSDSMEESIEMAHIAASCGTRVIAATPHCNIQRHFKNFEDSSNCREIYQQFKEAIAREKIPLQVVRGMEIFGVGDIQQMIKERKLISLNHSGYYLIEFPFDMHPEEITDSLDGVFRAGGIPVMAHPERYYCVQDTPNLIYDWMKDGVLTQVNKGSFLGDFGRNEERTAVTLLEHNLITCLASDCHGTQWRAPDMRDIRRYIRSRAYEETADLLLFDNPKRILTGKSLVQRDMSYVRERRWFM